MGRSSADQSEWGIKEQMLLLHNSSLRFPLVSSDEMFYSSELVNDKIVTMLKSQTKGVSHLISEWYKLVGQFTSSGFEQTMWVQMKRFNINLTFENGSIDPDIQCKNPTF